MDIPITFTNIPRHKVLTYASDSVIQIEILDKGSNIFRMLYVDEVSPVAVSLKYLPVYPRNGSFQGIINTALLINEIERESSLLGKVISVSPDSIYLSFETEKSVKIPVTAEFDLTFEKEFMHYGMVTFSPDSVTVKGPERIINVMESANLGKIKIEHLEDNYTGETSFEKDSMNRTLTFYPENVTFTIPVEKFTEAEVEVPVQIINSNSLQAKTFPDKVRVYYTVALKDYPKIEPGMIQATADLSQVDLSADDRIKVVLINYPSYIRINKINPEKVEFIIIK
jgi:YbbR domain-containing protein